MLHVVCLKWGTKYGPEYVNRLFGAVKRNLTKDFTFNCFTENPADLSGDICIQPLPFKGIDSWWNKLYLFSEEMPIKGQIFFIDLDTLITGNIDHLVDPEGFVVLRDFYSERARGVSTTDMGSGLMAWDTTNGQPYPEIWTKFIQNPTASVKSLRPHGDQRWIQKFVHDRKYWQDLFPKEVVSFKVHCNKGLPSDAKVVCYHGKPSIPESIKQTNRVPHFTIPPQAWVKDHWRE